MGKVLKEKIQFYSYAMDSARECIPMIKIAEMQKQINADDKLALRSQCIEITSMLYNLVQSVN